MAKKDLNNEWVSVHKLWSSILMGELITPLVLLYGTYNQHIGLKPDLGFWILIIGAASSFLCFPLLLKYKDVLKENPIIGRESAIEKNIKAKMVYGSVLFALIPMIFSIIYYVVSEELIGFLALWLMGVVIVFLFRPSIAYKAETGI